MSGKVYWIGCPHCQGTVEIKHAEIACTIFRHGIHKKTGKQMNPHLSKQACDRLACNNLIWGCGKPFKFDGTTVSKCEYI